ncbi:MAG: hypothetical protein LUD74_00175 [Tannerellaceae bacterium]|nr:hypothetical protein [Tannerellaceae bacterium]
MLVGEDMVSVVAGKFIENINIYKIKHYLFPAQAGIAPELSVLALKPEKYCLLQCGPRLRGELSPLVFLVGGDMLSPTREYQDLQIRNK